MAVGVVAGLLSLPPGGGADGGGDERRAAAVTTGQALTTTNCILLPPPISHPGISLPGDNHHAPLVRANPDDTIGDAVSSLLPSTANGHSISMEGCRRSRSSGGPLRVPRMSDCSLPPPAVVEGRAALRGGGRPPAHAPKVMTTARPRPGPASLLSALPRPQLGRVTVLGGRAGVARRATGTGDSDVAICGNGLISGTAHARRMTKQVTLIITQVGASPESPRGYTAQRAGAAAGLCASTRMSTTDDRKHDDSDTQPSSRPGILPTRDQGTRAPAPCAPASASIEIAGHPALRVRQRRG